MKYSTLISKKISKEPEIIGRDRYLNSAVLIPIVELNGVENLLFQKRSLKVRQPGEVSFPGGHYESQKDNGFLSTALRETCEELGIEKKKIRILGKLGTFIGPMGVIVEAFIGKLKISSPEQLNIDTNEVERIFVLPIDFFLRINPLEFFTRVELHPSMMNENGDKLELLPVKDLGLPERYALPWTNGKHRVLVYKNSEETIWGITAELVFELINRIKSCINE
ncbi:MAG: CoA pyrophosphatase [Ignavibacterium sp.]|jgi:8-oxo-dGTP pyrophosphatase MutT (NUDIX family)|nr:CoA pyrophosphatase [Ignavibacterium sp.]